MKREKFDDLLRWKFPREIIESIEGVHLSVLLTIYKANVDAAKIVSCISKAPFISHAQVLKQIVPKASANEMIDLLQQSLLVWIGIVITVYQQKVIFDDASTSQPPQSSEQHPSSGKPMYLQMPDDLVLQIFNFFYTYHKVPELCERLCSAH